MVDAQNDLKTLIYVDESAWTLNHWILNVKKSPSESMLGEKIKPVINCVQHTADDDSFWQQRKEQATSNRNDQEKSILEIEAASLSILTTLLSQRFRKK